jgi:MFS family permease
MTAVATDHGKIDIGRVVKEIFGLLKRNFVPFFVLALLLYGLPSLVLALLTPAPGTTDPAQIFQPFFLFTALISLAAQAILTGALVYGTVEDLNGRRASVAASLSTGLHAFLPIIGLSFLLAIAITFGFMLLIVPGVMLLCAWLVTVPAYVSERPGFLAAFGRSAQLTRGNRWRIFGLLLLLLLFSLVITMIAGAIGVGALVAGGDPQAAATDPIFIAFNVVIGTISSLVGAVAVAVLYVELRRARDGLGVQDLADVFR